MNNFMPTDEDLVRYGLLPEPQKKVPEFPSIGPIDIEGVTPRAPDPLEPPEPKGRDVLLNPPLVQPFGSEVSPENLNARPPRATLQDIIPNEAEIAAALDKDESGFLDTMWEQTKFGFMRMNAAVLSGAGRELGRFFNPDEEGVVIKDPNSGLIMRAEPAPAEWDQRQLWKKQVVDKFGDNAHFTTADEAYRVQQDIAKLDHEGEGIQDFEAQNFFRQGLAQLQGSMLASMSPLSMFNPIQYDGQALDETFNGALSQAAGELQDKWEDVAEVISSDAAAQLGPNPSMGKQIAAMTGQSIGQVVPSMLLFAGTRGLAGSQLMSLGSFGAVAGMVSGQDWAEQGRDLYRTRLMQKLDAGIETLTELPVLKALDVLEGPILDAAKDAVKPVMTKVKEVGDELLRGYLQLLYRELPSEMVATATQAIAARMVMNPDQPFDEFMKQTGKELVMTMAGVPITTVAQRMAVEVPNKLARFAEAGANKLVDIGAGSVAPLNPVIGDLKENIQNYASVDENYRQNIARIQGLLQDIDMRMKGYDEESATIDMLSNSKITPVNALSLMTSNVFEENVQGAEPKEEQELKEFERILENELTITKRNGQTGLLKDVGIQPGEVVYSGIQPKDAPIKDPKLQKYLDAAQIRLEAVWDLAQDIVNKFMPDARIVFSADGYDFPSMQTNYKLYDNFKISRGRHGTFDGRYRRSDTELSPLMTINLNFNMLRGVLATPLKGSRSVTTMIHELGHALFAYTRFNLGERYPNIMKLLHKAHIEELSKTLNNAKTRFQGLMSPGRALEFIKNAKGHTTNEFLESYYDKEGPAELAYFFGRDEFIAEQLVNNILNREDIPAELDEFLKELSKETKKLYTEVKKQGYLPNESYQEFLRAVMLDNELAQLKKEQAINFEQMQRAIAELKTKGPQELGAKQFNKLIDDLIEVGGAAVEVELVGETAGTEKKSRQKGAGSSPPRKRKTIKMREFQSNLNKNITRYTVITRMMAGIVQILNLNSHIESVRNFVRANENFRITASRWTNDAIEVLLTVRRHTGSTWSTSDHSERFDAAIMEMDELSSNLGRGLTPEEKRDVLNKYKLDQNDLYVMQEIWDLFKKALTEMEEGLIEKVKLYYSNQNNPEAFDKLEKEIRQIRSDYEKMRNRNYIPHTRFGKYTVRIYAKEALTHDGKEYKKGETILYEAFDRRVDRERAMKEVGVVFANPQYGVTTEILSDSLVAFQGLPLPLLERMSKELKLDEDQLKKLRELMVKSTPGQSIRKHMLERKGTAGYSTDLQRVFSDYFSRFSTFIARVKHTEEFERALNLAKIELAEIDGKSRGDRKLRDKRARLIHHMERQYQYLLNPGEEFANIRAAGFVLALGFMAKSAFVNLTQVPFVVAPYLSKRFGYVNTTAEMMRTFRLVGDHFQARMRGKDSPLNPEILAMWDELKARQILDEGMTTMLAGLANDRTLLNLKTKGRFAQGVRSFQVAAGWMFTTAEKMNRYYTATASFNLARAAGKTMEEAVEFAYISVRTTQLEYARFNRPEIMRGPTSPIFLFYQYLTQMMYFIGTDPARWRYLFMLMLAGGYTALPGMETFLNVMDLAATKFKEKLGMENPKVQLRVEIAKLINQLADEVSWLPERMSAYVEDGFMGNFFGYNMQSSISLGEITIFDTSVLSMEGTIEDKVGRLAQSGAGYPAEFALQLIYATFSEQPWSWNVWQKAMPAIGKAVSKAVRTYQDQQVLDASGDTVIKFDLDNPYGVTAALAEAAGASRRDVMSRKEALFWAKDAARYYANREAYLMNEYYVLRKKEEGANPPTKEDWDAFDRRMEHYNKTVRNLDPRLTMHYGRLADSWEQRLKNEINQDVYGHKQAKYGEIGQEIIDARR